MKERGSPSIKDELLFPSRSLTRLARLARLKCYFEKTLESEFLHIFFKMYN